MNNNVENFKSICDSMADTYERKNKDYGDSFSKSLDKFGLVASIVRMGDKMNRIENLVSNKPLVDESIEDTLLDLACYAVMTLTWLKGKRE